MDERFMTLVQMGFGLNNMLGLTYINCYQTEFGLFSMCVCIFIEINKSLYKIELILCFEIKYKL